MVKGEKAPVLFIIRKVHLRYIVKKPKSFMHPSRILYPRFDNPAVGFEDASNNYEGLSKRIRTWYKGSCKEG
jgi:hypothetical protein